MPNTVTQTMQELADREAIRDCLYRYCRGIDRSDAELLRSAYWPGAMDYHTGFTGTVEQFIEWALPRLAAMEQQMHMIGNILIRLDGDKARVESYFWSVAVLPGDVPQQNLAAGRYLDQFEKRGDEWRIAERLVAHDWFNQNEAVGDWSVGPFGMTGLVRGVGGREDKSYSWLGLE
jgi:SnoaL-like protein